MINKNCGNTTTITELSSNNNNDPNSISNEKSSIYDNIPKKGLTVMHLNIQAITNKLDQIKIMITDINETRHKNNIIFGITETHLNNTWSDDEIKLDNFTCVRKDRSYSGGGGILAFVPNSINFDRRADLENFDNNLIETICIEISFHISSPILICFLYRPPSNSVRWRDELKNMIINLENEVKEVIILGDFNVNVLNRSQYRPLKLITTSYQYEQLIDKVTRPATNTIIDHIYTTHPQFVLKSGVIEVGVSDHYPIFITRKINPKEIKAKKHEK